MTGSSSSDRSLVTRVIAYNVRLGEDARFQAWQKAVGDAALAFPGALRVDVLPSNITDSGHEWIVIYRFRSEADLAGWLQSREHASGLAAAPDIFAGEQTEYTLSGDLSPDGGETIVTSNEVSPDKEAEYEAADRALNDAAALFPGFAGARVMKPRTGSRTWSTMVRFKSKAEMDRWLASPERAAGLVALYQATLSHQANVVPTGFGSWFAVNAEAGIEAPAWKQAMIVLAVLFPTVMLLNATFGELAAEQGVSLALNVFIGNALSIAALTWVLMPALTRAMAWWLTPSCASRDTWLGAALLAGVYAVEVGIFQIVL